MAKINIKPYEEHNVNCTCKRCGKQFTFIGLTDQKADYCPNCLQALYEEYLEQGQEEQAYSLQVPEVPIDDRYLDCLYTPMA